MRQKITAHALTIAITVLASGYVATAYGPYLEPNGGPVTHGPYMEPSGESLKLA